MLMLPLPLQGAGPRHPRELAYAQEAPGLNGDDIWAGRVGLTFLEQACNEATSLTTSAPIIPQFYPQRRWLWRKWQGTILPRVMPREVLCNLLFATVCVRIFRARPLLAPSTRSGCSPGPRVVHPFLLPHKDTTGAPSA